MNGLKDQMTGDFLLWVMPWSFILPMKIFIKLHWSKFGIIAIYVLKPGMFLFKFDAEGNLRAVLEKGPWFFFWGKPLILKPWYVDFDLDQVETNVFPIWIQLLVP